MKVVGNLQTTDNFCSYFVLSFIASYIQISLCIKDIFLCDLLCFSSSFHLMHQRNTIFLIVIVRSTIRSSLVGGVNPQQLLFPFQHFLDCSFIYFFLFR